MTVRPDEDSLAEQPALDVFKRLGYGYVYGETLVPGCADRENLRDVILASRLRAAIRKLNPWINDANLSWAVHRISEVQATDLMETNEKLHADLVQHLSREQEIDGKKKHQTIRLIDWEKPENNDFLVVNQLTIRGDEEKRPDIVVFVNGIPLAVIECKSPRLSDPKAEGVLQVGVYSDVIPRLFWTNHFIVVAAGHAGAWYGGIGATGSYFFEWKQPWPTTVDDIEKLIERKPTPQDVLLVSLFEKSRFLDHVQNFLVYEREGNKTIKKLPRYQQYNAVSKAVARIRAGKAPSDKGGVVWHTQGSGKSLTMVWLALKLRRDPLNQNPSIVLVTDRTDLDRQIKKVFTNTGFPDIHRCGSVRDLREQLRGPGGFTLTTTIHKFQEDEASPDQPIPLLSQASNMFVLVDEAHRTQYRSLAANMRTALPNATFLGFTGTPIEKNDKVTTRTFGTYIDTYTIQQAVEDGATVPIIYEGRLVELRIEGGESLDKLFDRFFKDKTDEERAEIKKRYAVEEAVAAAPDRIHKITLDLLEHYEKRIAPNGFKAQVVAVNREAAVIYKERLDALNAPLSAVVISVDHNDKDPRFKACKRTKEQQAELIEDFLDKDNPLKILVVCDMLLTGFDAPVEQVMYLDKGLKEHNLLQAIARVNRPCGTEKGYGLIVDYWGVSGFLEQALAMFTEIQMHGTITARADELPKLEAHYAQTMRFFQGFDLKNGRFDNEHELNDVLERCVQYALPEDKRAQFMVAFRELSRSLDMVLPDPEANRFRHGVGFLGMVYREVARRARDQTMDLDGCGEKVRQLIAEHVKAVKIDLLVEAVPILAAEFDQQLERLRSPRAKASEMEHAIKHEIRIKLEEDPAFYESLRKKLEQIIEDRKQNRLTEKDEFERLRALIDEARDREKAAQAHGLNEKEFAFYGLLKGDTSGDISKLSKNLAKEIVVALEDEAVLDWEIKPSVQKAMRRRIKGLLSVGGVEENEIEATLTKILDLARTKFRTKG
jgi:type I restriction enzyme R subunit